MGIVLEAVGQFEERGDSDWFRVYLVAGKTYELQTGVDVNFYLPSGDLLGFPIPFSNYANFVAPVTGEYFIAANSFGTQGFYQLHITDIPDPNPGSPDTHLSIAAGQTLNMNSNAVNIDYDWFKFTAEIGKSYVFATNAITDRVYIVDANGGLVSIEGDNGGQQVHFTVQNGGEYFAVVQNGGGGPYSLSMHEVPDDHGEAPDSAGTLSLGVNGSGTWEIAGDDDWYAINLQAGSTYRFSVENIDDWTIPGTLAIADSSGEVLFTSLNSLAQASMVFSPEATGTYYVLANIPAVSSPDPQYPKYLEGWDYNLNATLLAGDIASSTFTAGTIQVDGQAQGNWESVGDADWFAVNLTADTAYTFNLTTSVWNGVSLALFDGTGNQVVPWTNNTNTGSYLHHTVETSGTYFLAARGAYQIGSYSLTAADVADDLPDNASTSGVVAVGGTAQGVSEAPGDSDWFAVELVAGHTYRLDDAAWAFRDAQGNLLTQPNWSDRSFTPSQTGTYYVEAIGYGGYTVGVTEIGDDFPEDETTTGMLYQNIFGTVGPDTLVGDPTYDFIFGDSGNDLISGGPGSDLIVGGNGSDTASYAQSGKTNSVDLALTIAQDTLSSGADTLFSIENLLGGTKRDLFHGNHLANTLDGQGGDDRLFGRDGDDKLVGGVGNDKLAGDAGNDLLIGGSGNDYLSGGDGEDTASYADQSTTTVVDLRRTDAQDTRSSGNDTIVGVEVLIGGSKRDIFYGDANANGLHGGKGDDRLFGNGGNDWMIGGEGNDKLWGGTGSDQFLFDSTLNAVSNIDHILDFSHGIDKIVLENGVFATLATGALSANAFFLGTAAGDASDRIIYNAATGALYYDSDGTGAAAAVQFAVLDTQPASLAASDFLVI